VSYDDVDQMAAEKALNIGAESARVSHDFFRENAAVVAKAAQAIAEAFKKGNRLFIFGNGGSASDAQHIAAEFVNRFMLERPGLPAIALTTDCSVLTSIGNDYGFKYIFSRQLKALAQPGDVVWGISTSGVSPNILEALNTARKLGLTCLAMTGGKDSQAALISDIALEVQSPETPRVQETHIVIGHAICELVDLMLFEWIR